MINRIVKYYNDVVFEMKKVSFPTWDELKGTTIVVLITSAVFTVFIWLSDVIFGKLISLIYKVLA